MARITAAAAETKRVSIAYYLNSVEGRNMTQADIAKVVGCSLRMVSQVAKSISRFSSPINGNGNVPVQVEGETIMSGNRMVPEPYRIVEKNDIPVACQNCEFLDRCPSEVKIGDPDCFACQGDSGLRDASMDLGVVTIRLEEGAARSLLKHRLPPWFREVVKCECSKQQ